MDNAIMYRVEADGVNEVGEPVWRTLLARRSDEYQEDAAEASIEDLRLAADSLGYKLVPKEEA